MSKEKMVFHQNMKLFGVSIPKGTFVRQKEWVGLTDEEGAEIWGDFYDIDYKQTVTPKELFKRIEEKLKEKNT